MKIKTILGLLLVACVWGVTANALQSAAACDRECLRGKVTQLLYAFLKHDVSGVPVANTLRVTEDAVEKPLAKVGLVNTMTGSRLDRAGVKAKFGVVPALIPDYLALVGDAADGYPGLAGMGPKTAATLLNKHGPIERFPVEILGDRREDALLFKRLATLVADAPVLRNVDELQWRGAPTGFAALAEGIDSRLAARAERLRPA